MKLFFANSAKVGHRTLSFDPDFALCELRLFCGLNLFRGPLVGSFRVGTHQPTLKLNLYHYAFQRL